MNLINNDEKSGIPICPSSMLPRTDLYQICHGLHHKIIYVFAGIGWGKTTAFADWARRISNPVYWITLEEKENQWSNLKILLEKGTAFSYATLNDRCLLVLDDFYKITDKNTLKNLAEFIENSPDNFHFLLLGRQTLPESLSEFLIKRQLFLISNDALRLNLEENRSYLKLLGCDVSYEDNVELRSISDGWPLYLNMISLEILQNSGQVLRGNQYLYSRRMISLLLEKELLSALDDKLQKCLLLLSFLKHFSLKEAEVLTGMDDTQHLLEHFMLRNSLIISIGDQTYRFQQNIYDFISLIRDQRLTPDQMDSACLRLGHYYETEGLLLQSLNAYDKRKLYPESIRVLKILLKNHPATQDFYKIEDYMLQLPEEFIKEEPLLCSGRSMIHSINYRPKEAQYWYNILLDMRKTLPTSKKKEENLDQIIAHANIAIPVIYDDKRLVKQIWNGAKLNVKTGSQFFDFTVTGNQPRILAGSRDFSNWTRHAHLLKKLLSAPLESILGEKTSAVIDTGMAETYYQHNTLNSSMIEVSKAIAKSLKFKAMDILFVDRAITAQIHHAQGKMPEARKIIYELKTELVKNNADALFDNVRAFSALQDLIEGKNEKALEWSINHTPDESLGFRVLDRYLYLIKIRVYLCNGYLNKALPLIEVIQNYAMDYSRHYNLIETTILKAICLDKMKEYELADETMLNAIDLAKNYHFIRVFADEGLGCYQILERLEKHQNIKDKNFLMELLAASSHFYRLYPAYYQLKDESDTPLLTRSEKNVLEQISTGKTNAEICDTLNISMSTVKTHINRIYGKLAVRNRTQALIKAKELKIL